MKCASCQNKAVIALQHGNLCRSHFIKYFEDKVFRTINRYQLIGRTGKICVATSGGKDSLSILYLTKKYLDQYKIKAALFALAVDEGIKNYRKKTLADLKQFCNENKIPMKIVKSKDEFGLTLDKAYKKINKTPCNICGVWRRYLLNKYAKKYGATLLVTGHNLDDEAQAIMMNIFKSNTKIAGRLGPKTGTHEHDLFIPRVKPLYFCSEKEVRLYALLKLFRVQYAECPYSGEGYRSQIQTMLNEFEHKYRGTKQGIINSFLDILPLLKERSHQLEGEIKPCKKCKEAANQEVCNACKMKEMIAK